MTTTTPSRKISALIESFERRRPMRAGSLIVTIYGDAIVPRGGSLWLGSLLDMMAGFGVEPGLVRTAVSRLVADGWFERTRIGKQSYYRLSQWGGAEFATATSRIYRPAEPPWSGEIEVAIITTPDAPERATRRERMLRAGWGQAAANVLVRPHAPAASQSAACASDDNTIVLVTHPQGAEKARALARACWQLDHLDAAYRQFLKAFGPVAEEIAERRASRRGAGVPAAHPADPRLAPHRAARSAAAARHAARGLAGHPRPGARLPASIARPLRAPSAGLTATPSTRRALCRRPRPWSSASSPSECSAICYRKLAYIFFL